MQHRICKQCNKSYLPPATKTNKFWCSWACYNLGRKGVARKEARYSWGYRYLFKPEHPDSSKQGYIAEHRIIGEQLLKRRLLRTEVVHHINGIRDDNRLCNIVVCTRAEHNKIDEEIIKGKLKRTAESRKEVTQLNKNKDFLKIWISRTEAAKFLGCSISLISYAAKHGSLAQGFYWK